MYKIEYDKELSMVNCWEELSLSQFIEIQQILEADIPEHYKSVNVVSVLTSEPLDYIEQLPIKIFMLLNNQTNFLNTQPPKIVHKESYILHDRKYNLKAEIYQITTAQYIDYQSCIKKGDLVELLSLFLIPDEHSYNDGYDLKRVKLDIEDMNILDVNAIAFFLRVQLAAFILISKDYLIQNQKKTKREKKSIKTLYNNMAYSLLS